MKRTLCLLVGVLLLVSLVGFVAACGGDEEPAATTAAPTETTAAPTETTAAPAGDAKVLRMAVPWPVGDPVTDNIQQNFVDKFNAAQSQYTIELHPAASLLALGDSFEAVRTGGTRCRSASRSATARTRIEPEYRSSVRDSRSC